MTSSALDASAAAPRPAATPPRQRILAAASRLFYAHGIRGVGVDALVAESGVAKATFYKHFAGKDDLVVAYLDRVHLVWTARLRRAAAAAGPDPAERLVAMFDAVERTARRRDYRGCAFINAAAESAPGSPVHARSVAHKDEVRAWVGTLAAQAGATDPSALARALTLLLDGVLAAGALGADDDAAASARRSASLLVAAATGQTPRAVTGATPSAVTGVTPSAVTSAEAGAATGGAPPGRDR